MTMKKFVAILAAMMFAILAIVPMGIASAESTRMYVTSSNGGSVRLRSLPADAGKILTNFNVGRPVEVMGRYGDWSEVRVQVNGKYVYGYMMNKFLTAKDPATKAQRFTDVKNSFSVHVRTASGNGVVSVWKTTNKNNDQKLFDLSQGDRMTVIAESNAWYKIKTENGVVGYLAKAYVTKC